MPLHYTACPGAHTSKQDVYMTEPFGSFKLPAADDDDDASKPGSKNVTLDKVHTQSQVGLFGTKLTLTQGSSRLGSGPRLPKQSQPSNQCPLS